MCYVGYWLLELVVDIIELGQLCSAFEVNVVLHGILVARISG